MARGRAYNCGMAYPVFSPIEKAGVLLCAIAAVAAFPTATLAADPLDERRAAENVIISALSKADQEYVRVLTLASRGPVLNVSSRAGMKPGTWGRPERQESVVRSRPAADGRSMINVGSVIGGLTDFDVNEIIDDQSMLIYDWRLWVEGVDTTGIADDNNVDLAGQYFEVRGTKKYETAIGGSRTVLHLAKIDLTKALAAAEQLRSLQDYTVWKDETGKHSVLAKFIDFKKGRVTLESIKGKQSEVALKQLGKDEQKIVRDLVKRRSGATAGGKSGRGRD
jgi:hypothetical protein